MAQHNNSRSNAGRWPSRWPSRWLLLVPRLLPLLTLLTVAIATSACGNAEFEQVRGYKEFLTKARPPLQAMNKVRQELYEAEDLDAMLIKFDTGLLANIETLQALADAESVPAGKLGDLHGALKKNMGDYVTATKRLVKRLKDAKMADNMDEIQRAILEWGAKDKEFGDQMSKLVGDLNGYLDHLVKG